MKRSLENYITMFKNAFGFLIMLWAMIVFTVLLLRVTSVDVLASADSSYWIVIGSIITFLAVPIHHWFKNRK